MTGKSPNAKKQIKHLRRGLSIYKTGRSPFWHARLYDSVKRRYVVKSTKETSRLDAAEVAEEILADYRAKQNTNHAAQKDRSFEHYARLLSEMTRVQKKGARNKYAFSDEYKILYREGDAPAEVRGQGQHLLVGSERGHLGRAVGEGLSQADGTNGRAGAEHSVVWGLVKVMSEKIQFRHRAREHFKAAQALVKTEEAELLLPAALRLRMAIECLAYELLQSLQNDAGDGTMETWQPGKLIKELKEIDAGIESDHTISIGIEDVPGEPAKTMHSLGTDARLKASWISKHWNALGSYLHEPTIKQHKDGKVFDPESAREKIVAISAEIERVLSSSIFASNIAAFITFTCECGHSIKRRESLIEKESSITCAKCQSIWNAERIDGQWRLAYLYHNFVCPNCDEKNQVPAKEPQEGLEFDCRACGAVSSIQRGWTLRLQSVPNRQSDK